MGTLSDGAKLVREHAEGLRVACFASLLGIDTTWHLPDPREDFEALLKKIDETEQRQGRR